MPVETVIPSAAAPLSEGVVGGGQRGQRGGERRGQSQCGRECIRGWVKWGSECC